MNHALHDLARHNAWATAELITFCHRLDEPTLQATVPGTYGTIIATLRHLVDSEASYLFRLHGALAGYPWPADDAVGLEVLAERADLIARTWEQFLAGDVDTERRMEARGSDPPRYTTPAGVMLAYVFEHATEHRAHICTILGARGYEAPDVSAWGYGFASGRSQV